MNPKTAPVQKTDKPLTPALTMESLTSYARQLNQREQDAKARIMQAQAELETIRNERDSIRDRAEEIAEVLTPKRQRRNRDDDPIADNDTQPQAFQAAQG